MKKEKLQQLGHLIAGLIVMVHGFESLENGDYKPAAGYLGIAIVFMLIAGWHKTLQQFLQGDAAFFLLEAVIMFYSAWHYSLKEKTFLYYGMAASGVVFVVFSILTIAFNNDMPKRGRRRKKRKRSSSSGSFEDKFNAAINKGRESATDKGNEGRNNI